MSKLLMENVLKNPDCSYAIRILKWSAKKIELFINHNFYLSLFFCFRDIDDVNSLNHFLQQ